MKLSITTKINIFTGFLVVVPIVFLGWFFIRHEAAALQEELTLRGQSLVENSANTFDCELAMMAQDRDRLTQILREITKEKDAVYALAKSPGGEEVARSGVRNTEGTKEFSAPVITRIQTREDTSMDDAGNAGESPGQEVIGAIIVGISWREVELKTEQLRIVLIMVLAGVVLLSITGVLFGTTYLINKPLKDLISSVETIGIGDLSHRVAVKSSDEIGKLAESFNMMTENLSSLMVSKNYLDNVLESMNDILIVFSLTGVIKTVNRATSHLLGYKEIELTGESFHRVLPDERLLFNEARWHELIHKDIIYNNEEKHFLKKDGSTIPVSFSATFMYDNSGNVQGIIGVGQDMTEKKQSEEDKRQLEKRLQLAEKMEALGRLAGGVAHDLNNTLGAIVGYPDLLLRKLPEDTPHKKAITTIKQSGQRAADIVRDLLTLARRGIPKSEIVNLNQVIWDHLGSPEFEKLKIHHPGMSVTLQLENDLLCIHGSPVHLTKTIMNLVTNAAEAIEMEGKITITSENRYVDKVVTRDELGLQVGEYVVITIADTGIGIPPEDLKRIFEPFFSRKVMDRSGTGLGMAVVWGTVKDHNGYIDVKSKQGEGTTFTLFFPSTREEPGDGNGNQPFLIEKYKGDGQKILVVDDIKDQREISAGLLTALDYSVEAVNSGEEAIEYIKTAKVDLVILDMIMEPGMDGLDTFLKIMEIAPETKTIIASGFSETDRVRETLKKGACTYIQKPFTLEKIARIVRKEIRPKA
jgi:PAS domain S-box-containing protein